MFDKRPLQIGEKVETYLAPGRGVRQVSSVVNSKMTWKSEHTALERAFLLLSGAGLRKGAYNEDKQKKIQLRRLRRQ